MNTGVHVSIAGGIDKAAERAYELGCSTFQIFSKNPRGWKAKDIVAEDIISLKQKRKDYALDPLVVHISYLPNLAAEDENLYKKSVNAFKEELIRADKIGADYLVFHPGRNKNPDKGFALMFEGLKKIFTDREFQVSVLMENTAGAGKSLGGSYSSFSSFFNSIKEIYPRFGLCLDTCHAWAYGYDIVTEDGLKEMMLEIVKLIGLNNLKLIHANDSQFKRGSKKDRHEHIGEGEIGIKGFENICQHDFLKDLPFILETPRKSSEDDRRNLKKLADCF